MKNDKILMSARILTMFTSGREAKLWLLMKPVRPKTAPLIAFTEPKPSALKALVGLGEYAKAIESWKSLAEPTAEDDRWAGASYFGMANTDEAKRVLSQAIRRGSVAARIELASAFRVLHRCEIAASLLDEIDTGELSVSDRARYFRERAEGAFSIGDMSGAVAWFELALAEAELSEDRIWLGVAVSFSLAAVAAEQGNFRRSLEAFAWVIEFSPVQIRRGNALMLRSKIRLYIGDFDGSLLDLQTGAEAMTGNDDLVFQALYLYVNGTRERFMRHWRDAILALDAACKLMLRLDRNEAAVYAETSAVAVYLAQARPTARSSPHLDQARARLSAARSHVRTPNAGAICDVREGQWLTRAGMPNLVFLDQAVVVFTEIGCRPESGWALLHLADAHVGLENPTAAREALDRLADVVHAMADPSWSKDGPEMTGFLTAEIASLTHVVKLRRLVSEYARFVLAPPVRRQKPRALAATIGATGHRLFAFDLPRLEVHGVAVSLGTKRALEAVVLLALRPNLTLEQIVTAIDPDGDPRRMKNLFHQVKFQVRRFGAGLEIVYDSVTLTYRVDAPAGWRLDVSDALEALRDGTFGGFERALALRGSFLPASDSAWVRAFRIELDRSFSSAAARVVAELVREGEFLAVDQLRRQFVNLELFPESEIGSDRIGSDRIGSDRIGSR
jgi:tetratricopeptide (TPR) repeat protein